MTGYEKLANAIIIKAVRDYKKALRKNNEKEIRECERFFISENYKALTKVDGEMLMKKIKEETLNG